MEHQEIISIYQEVAVITDQMLAAARNSDWDALVSLESDCASRINLIRHHDLRPPLSPTDREQKISIIKQILAHDNAIRTLTEPRLAQLSSLIASSGNERKLNSSYNAGSTG